MEDEKEKIMFLGDSITRHYFTYAKAYLLNHNIEAIIPEKWVSCQWKQERYYKGAFAVKRKYNGRKVKSKTVHFNFGLHSIKLPDKGRGERKRARDEDFEIYEKELKQNIEKLREFNRHVIFSNTTPNPKNAGMRNDLDVVILNESAERVMKEYDVPHNDLYSFVKSQPNYPTLYMHPKAENNCHFLNHGRKLLGENVAKFALDNFVGNS
jgi:hypothetical protein